ncbi:hypothetical protein ANAPRD1_01143 [Anaplasma phagocytophilum]|nr:hypothetical protein ANAPC2_00683 [Anaplasma phagocytophilum]SBO32529.1 hypothetical protein ANAPC4_00842 [Anaplasma phagocytophilum]SBO33304.1 hypothetical protein ANAPC3_01174 [Anaplasma phagocytophilum]SCV64957.1 hypothetical protein ANAPC5_01011 [Anaplasma phagocytophilum]SCV66572.1 hypothetical protein ANAPRD1_01143 [Anaplasma phagocytophilum]
MNPQLIKVKVSGEIPISFGLDYKACINQQRYCVLECVPDVFSAYTFLEKHQCNPHVRSHIYAG